MEAGCGPTCKLKCHEKIDDYTRKAVFQSYWAMGDVNKQREFIARHTEKTKVERHRIRGKPRSKDPAENTDQHYKRTSTIKYFFTVESDKIKVCLTFFLATLDVSHKFVKNAISPSPAGIIQNDRRGKKSNPKKTPEHILECIRKHIASFDAVPSHYCRKESKRTYLSENLNITEMHRLYVKECTSNGSPASSRAIYRRVFCDEFNLSFHVPKKDACSVCEGFKSSSPEQREQQEEAFKEHMKNKEEARELKLELKMKAEESETFYAGCFDLQQVLQCPYGRNNLFYYKRKLDVYNLSVYSLGDGDAHCYLWDEMQANRGANEVGSCLFKHWKKLPERERQTSPCLQTTAPDKIKIVIF
jgi:hypothetical protein